ncbi:MAG: transcription antitermination factor NusB [Planctomycetota bacterium]|nr:transcription antitermination factor NusB [Planctomycetota bacterium]
MPRHAAFLALRHPSGKPLAAVDEICARRALDERDTALTRALVGVEVRHRATLRAVVAGFAHHKPKAELALLLRLGIAQLLYMDRVPAHAAVSETVRATADFLGLSKGKIVNGTLRSVQRALREGRSGDPTCDLVDRDLHFDGPVFRDPSQHPHLWAEDALSIPSALHKRWTRRYGASGADALARLALEEAPLSLRVRPSSERSAVREELVELDVSAREGGAEDILIAPPASAGVVLRSAAFREGRVTVQGEHAARAAALAGDLDGLDVLDLCAAPGGKAAALADRGPRSLVCADVGPRRLARVFGAFERLGHGAPHVVAMESVGALRPDARFDVVFIDAPCSNTGVLAQRPAARWRHGPGAIAELTALQGRLLREAAEHVRPGGALIHSTCSLEPEENEQLVRAFLAQNQAWRLEDEVRSIPRSIAEGGPVDGGYAARLVHS